MKWAWTAAHKCSDSSLSDQPQREYHWMPKIFQSVETEKNLSLCTFKNIMQKATTKYEVTLSILVLKHNTAFKEECKFLKSPAISSV